MIKKNLKIQFGCGFNKRKGYLNCDISSKVNPDKIINLERKLPFKDNSVNEIVMEHVLEHIKNIFPLLEEIYRICKNNALIKIKVPYFSHESAFSTMTHIRFFTYTSFDFLDKNNYLHYDAPNVNFKMIHKKLNWRKIFKPIELFWNFNPELTRIYQELFCWWFPAKELEIELKVIK